MMIIRILAVLFLIFGWVGEASSADKVEGIAQVKTDIQYNDLEEMMSKADVASLDELKAGGFDFKSKDLLGNTVLYYLLIKNPNPEVVQKAIEYGADVNEPAGNGMIPLNITTSKANELQLQIMMLKSLGVDISSQEAQEMLKENLFKEMNRMIELAKILIDNGADVNKESILGSPLSNAVTNAWNQDIAQLLIKAGANLNAQDKSGRTALFYAASGGNEDMITMLLKAGADPDIQDNAGKVYLDVEKVHIESPI